ncbi:MAG: hypothetical protein M0Q92_12200 [Methanoregula sp.]|jgi:hypothetical protein|nr:hypothetical protein [Methanoregula sp.]
MDELIAVGTAGILGLLLTALIGVWAVWGIASMVWGLQSSGDWQAIGRIVLVMVVAAAAYIGTGLWLRKTGRI